ncbi:MAG TPA: MFS transporter [Candidatus Goldiibacteriota bacterium]|nr:MFS transporter [Candidatus Goldiibacteriota bacterium]
MKTKTSDSVQGLFMLALIYIAFIALGMPDGLTGVAWPSMRKSFNIPVDAIGISMVCMTCGYLVSSFFSGRLISKLSIAGLLTLSCMMTGAALITECFVPSWGWYAAVSVLTGFGAGGIDAGLNTYVAANHGERQMHWMHASYGIGVTAGPFIMTAGLQYFQSWRPGFITVGLFQIALGIIFALIIKSWNRYDEAARKENIKKLTDYDTPILKTMAHIPAWIGMLLFFLYSGAEISYGFWIYSILSEARGVAPAIAGMLAGSFYLMFTLGRIAAGIYSKRIKTRKLVLISLASALAGSLLVWLNLSPVLSVAGIVIIGFSIAPVFPALVSDTKDRVGDHHAGNTIGMQMSAASLGSAFIPAFMGILARQISLEAITAVLAALFALLLIIYASETRRVKG